MICLFNADGSDTGGRFTGYQEVYHWYWCANGHPAYKDTKIKMWGGSPFTVNGKEYTLKLAEVEMAAAAA